MTPATKTKALEKWGTFTAKIGYPTKWRDWTGLEPPHATAISRTW
jgi:putative endopeptidase